MDKREQLKYDLDVLDYNEKLKEIAGYQVSVNLFLVDTCGTFEEAHIIAVQKIMQLFNCDERVIFWVGTLPFDRSYTIRRPTDHAGALKSTIVTVHAMNKRGGFILYGGNIGVWESTIPEYDFENEEFLYDE